MDRMKETSAPEKTVEMQKAKQQMDGDLRKQQRFQLLRFLIIALMLL